MAEVEHVANKISGEDIEKAIAILYSALENERQIFIIGNGGSASTAQHFACDLNKYATVAGKKRFRAISLEENIPFITALVNDEGWDNIYSYQLENLYRRGDVLVAISVHGGVGKDRASLWSQNLVKAVKTVKERGGKTVALTGFDGGMLRQITDACMIVPIDSTPQVEGFHLVLTHLICSCLREKIVES